MTDVMPPLPPIFCPHCQKPNRGTATKCWLCGSAIDPAAAATEPAPISLPRTFTLDTLVLVVVMFAVSLGVGLIHPGLGIGLAVLSAPALLRAAAIAERRRVAKQPLALDELTLEFLGSFAVVMTMAVAASIAFVATCYPLGWAGFIAGAVASEVFGVQGEAGYTWGFGGIVVIGFGSGIVVAFFVLRVLYRRLWKLKK